MWMENGWALQETLCSLHRLHRIRTATAAVRPAREEDERSFECRPADGTAQWHVCNQIIQKFRSEFTQKNTKKNEKRRGGNGRFNIPLSVQRLGMFTAYSAFKRVVKIQSKWRRMKGRKGRENFVVSNNFWGFFFSNSTDLSIYWLVLVGKAEKHPDSQSSYG